MKKAGWLSVFVALMLHAVGVIAQAQPVKKVPRIGIVVSGRTEGPNFVAFREGLRDLGYVEGQTLFIESRYGEGALDRMPRLVNELVEEKVDLLFVTNQVAIRAAKQATKTIPIVMLTSVDPVTAGLVNSLSHPAGILLVWRNSGVI